MRCRCGSRTVRVRGAWQEYDTTLVEQDDGSIAPAAVPDGVVLAGEVEG